MTMRGSKTKAATAKALKKAGEPAKKLTVTTAKRASKAALKFKTADDQLKIKKTTKTK